ncbi:MAG TPA: endonuclease/exonuclease/phosphatase family protein [Byssovorax sp.]
MRVLTANTTTGNDQSYDDGEGIRMFQGLHPDVALVQEFNYRTGSDADIRSMVDAAFGPEFDYEREATGAGKLPNGVVSRYPIVDRGVFVDPLVSNRSFVWARIDVPGAVDLFAVSLHLLTTSGTKRQQEAAALLADLAPLVPAGAMLVIGGDLNTDTRTESCVATFAQIVDVSAPYPVDNRGNDLTNGPRNAPHDWLFPNAPLRLRETPVVIGQDVFPPGLVFDSRVYTPLVDVAPVRLGDCDNTVDNIQHMPVVKDFWLGP